MFYFLRLMRETKLFLGRSLPWLVGVKLELKDYLVRAETNNLDTKEPKSARCNGKRCQVCQYIEETCEFEDADGSKYDIRKGVINCNTDFTVYKFWCSSCSEQYVRRNITDFRYLFNNYKSAFCKVSKSVKPPKVNQEHFHQHFKLPEHSGIDFLFFFFFFFLFFLFKKH